MIAVSSHLKLRAVDDPLDRFAQATGAAVSTRVEDERSCLVTDVTLQQQVREHLAGAVGAALCAHCFDKGWIRRVEGTRAVAITPRGQRSFRDAFGVRLS